MTRELEDLARAERDQVLRTEADAEVLAKKAAGFRIFIAVDAANIEVKKGDDSLVTSDGVHTHIHVSPTDRPAARELLGALARFDALSASVRDAMAPPDDLRDDNWPPDYQGRLSPSGYLHAIDSDGATSGTKSRLRFVTVWARDTAISITLEDAAWLRDQLGELIARAPAKEP